jgi:hypothetical protein
LTTGIDLTEHIDRWFLRSSPPADTGHGTVAFIDIVYGYHKCMVELIRTDNPVFLSWLRLVLAEAGIIAAVFDDHTSAAYGGALAAVPCRVMVAEDDLARARRVLAEAPDGGLDGDVGASSQR